MDELPALIGFRDAPVSEPSDVPIYLMAREARRHVKMVLTGEGADEILGGYPKHRFEPLGRYYRLLPGALRHRLLEPLLDQLPFAFRRARTAVGALGLEQFDERMARWFGALSASEREHLVAFAPSGEPLNVQSRYAPAGRVPSKLNRGAGRSPRPLQFDSGAGRQSAAPNPVFRPERAGCRQPARARRSDDDGGRARSANAFHGPRAGRLGGASARSLPGARLDRQMAAARSCPRPVAAPDPGAQENRLPRADRPMAARADARVPPRPPGGPADAHRPVLPAGGAAAGARRTSSGGESITKSCSGRLLNLELWCRRFGVS